MSDPQVSTEDSSHKKKASLRSLGTWSKKKKDQGGGSPPPEPEPSPAISSSPSQQNVQSGGLPTGQSFSNGSSKADKDKKSFMQTVSSTTTKWFATLGRKKGKRDMDDGSAGPHESDPRNAEPEFNIENIDLGRKKNTKAAFSDHHNIQSFFQDPTKPHSDSAIGHPDSATGPRPHSVHQFHHYGLDSSSERTPENSRSMQQNEDTASSNNISTTPKLCGSFPSMEDSKQDSDKSSTTDLSEHTSTVRSSVELDESGVEILMSKLDSLHEVPESKYSGYGLLKDIGTAEDINKRGLKRAKKHKAMSAYGNSPLQMEDAHCINFPFRDDPRTGLFCVFDGHSGKGASTTLTQVFPEVFHKVLLKTFPSMHHPNQGGKPVIDLTEVFFKSYDEADKQLKAYEYEGSTSTTVAIWQCPASSERYLQAANLGDSRAYLIRDNKALCLTTDHKLANPDEKVRVSQSTGETVNEGATRINGLAVTRAFGDHFMKDTKSGLISEPSVSSPYKLGSNDSFLILASDGLWDVISADRVVNMIQPLKNQAQTIATFLVQTAVKSTKCTDNVTVIVVSL